LIVGFNGFRVHRVSQREGPAERAILAFNAQVVFLVRLVLELAFAANGEDVVLDVDVQVLGIHIRQVRLDDQFMLGLVDVDCRGPRGQVRLLAGASHQITNHAIDLILHRGDPAEREFQTIHCSHCGYLSKALRICLSQSNFSQRMSAQIAVWFSGYGTTIIYLTYVVKRYYNIFYALNLYSESRTQTFPFAATILCARKMIECLYLSRDC